jgi:hypothetical protein
MKPRDYMATTLVLFVERVDAHTIRLIERLNRNGALDLNINWMNRLRPSRASATN